MIVAASGFAEPVTPVPDQKLSISEALPQRGSAEAIARGKAAMARARDVYSNLKTYSDHSVVRKYQNYTDRDYSAIVEAALTCERPGKFRVDFTSTPHFGQMTMVSDGQRYQRAVIESEVYTDDESPDLSAPIVFKDDLVAENVPPHFYLVARESSVPDLLLKTPREVIDSREEILDGRKGLRVTCLAASEQEKDKPDAKADIVQEFWFDEATGTIGEIVRDSTVRTRENDKERQPDRPTGESAHVAVRIATITRISDVRIDRPVAAEQFTLNPASQWKKVPEFIRDSGPDMGQYRTLGLAAPQFKLKDLDQKEVSLSDLAGRVVVLDFWATWCGPCVSAMPHLQKLQEEFKDQPLVIYGLNSDYGLSDEKLAAWMAKRNFTFGTLRLVGGGTTFQDFGVGGIPHTVLIDKKGVVQDVMVGFMGDEHGDILKDRIEKLLAGESLKTAEEFESLRDHGAKRRTPNVSYVRSLGEAASVDELNTGRFVVSAKAARNLWPSKACAIELAGGTKGVLCPVYNDGINCFSLLEPTTGRVRQIPLEGGGGEFLEWCSLQDGATKIVGFPWRNDRATFEQQFGSLVCWDLEGKRLWAIDLQLPQSSGGEVKLQTADIDGDGRPEILALVCVDEIIVKGKQRTRGKNLSKLCVLNADGKLLAVKQIPLYMNVSLDVIPIAGQPSPAIVVMGGGRIYTIRYDAQSKGLTGTEENGIPARTTSADPSRP